MTKPESFTPQQSLSREQIEGWREWINWKLRDLHDDDRAEQALEVEALCDMAIVSLQSETAKPIPSGSVVVPEDRLNAYRAALANLCLQGGGTLFVKTLDLTPQGSLLHRWNPDGLEFRFHADGEPQ
jgi:hypothetical protein